MSTRLTNDIRDGIRRALLDRRFSRQEDALKAREHALALKAYAVDYTPDYLAWLAAEPGKKPGHVAGQVRINSQAGGMRSLALADPQPVRNDPAWYGVTISGKVPAKLDKDICDLWSDKEALRAERRRESARLEGLLSAFTTTKKLIEAWPAVQSIVDTVVGRPTASTALALIPADMDALYDLPPEEIAA